MSAAAKGSQFRPLQTINEERVTHGLRYRDYTRYRKHCAHKTHRLRSTLKLSHGKGRDFKKLPPITAEGATDGHLYLLLFETERAWAHAQELAAPQDARRSTSRYRRSHNYLSRLLALARAPALPAALSAQSTAELLVYALIHTARLNLRRPSASTAAYYGLTRQPGAEDDADAASAHPLVQLSVAHALLDELEAAARTSKEVALARAFKDEIGPEVRWCVHEFGRGVGDDDDDGDAELAGYVGRWKAREWDVAGIVGDVAPAYAERVVAGYGALVQRLAAEGGGAGERNAGKRQVLEELVWEGEPVPVRNPELVDALLKVQDALTKLNADAAPTEETAAKTKGGRGRVSRYDGVLLALSDAADQARKIVEAQQLSGVSAAPSGGARDIHFMHAYLTYLHLTHRTARDLLLLAALAQQHRAAPDAKATAASLHLLSGILQALAHAAALPVAADLAPALAARLAHARAQRTLHLARAYAHPAHRRYAEALALSQRGLLHLREARGVLEAEADATAASPHLAFYPLDAGALRALEGVLLAEEARVKREWFAHNGGVVGPAAEGGHRKPLFFDIAFNHVEMPLGRLRARAGMAPREEDVVAAKAKVEEEEEEEAVVEEVPAPRGGLTGLLGSWWGRK